AYTASLAAMLIYLNRTGYNGLFRLNRLGRFNVPAGHYTRPRICDEANLHAVAVALARPRVEGRYGGFGVVRASARGSDFVYPDPPYAPVSETARFTSYTAEGFGTADQRRLQDVVLELAERGCQVLLSNSAVPATLTLYEDNQSVRRAGF